jgi:4-amino-4-deoxy-L-arabinose transferase-like glycosyltransferase
VKIAPWKIVALAAMVIAVVGRVGGVSDIDDDEQPRTTSYTADVVVNHRWALPYDSDGFPATKPPLFNWIGAAIAGVAGFSQFTLKAPSLLATAAGLLVVGFVAASTARRITPIEAPGAIDPAAAGWLAAMAWLICPANLKLMYLARVDMMLAVFLAGAWACGTAALRQERGQSSLVAAGFWACTAGAALTKGPMALLALLYAAVAAKVLGGSWSTLRRLHVEWGLPLLLVTVGGWAWAAYRQEPVAFLHSTVEHELGKRLGETPARWAMLYNAPMYSVARFIPWSPLAVLAVLHVHPRRWREHALGPAILWTLLLLGVFMIVPARRGDHIAPIFPALAVLAACWAIDVGRKYKVTPLHVALVGLLFSAAMSWRAISDKHDMDGPNNLAFARHVRRVVGDDAIEFRVRGRVSPVQPLLGRAQGAMPATPEQKAAAKWVVRVVRPGETATVLSAPMNEIDEGKAGRLGLFEAHP